MKTKTPHPHAKFLAEAFVDTSRAIEGKQILADYWQEVTLTCVVGSNALWEFRFVDTVKPQNVSSLTAEQLYTIVAEHNPDHEDVNYKIVRAVANAAAKKQMEDMAPPNLRLSQPYQPTHFKKSAVRF